MMTANTNRCKYGSEFHRVDLILYLMYNTKRSYFWKGGGEGREDQLHIKELILLGSLVLMNIRSLRQVCINTAKRNISNVTTIIFTI